MDWPNQWSFSQDSHGILSFGPDTTHNGWLGHDQAQSTKSVNITFSTDLHLNLDPPLWLNITVEKPKKCGVDVLKDPFCDDARSLLVGRSTSVGQTCSIAKAVSEDPSKIPGTCCLDNVKTLQNFGERVSRLFLPEMKRDALLDLFCSTMTLSRLTSRFGPLIPQ